MLPGGRVFLRMRFLFWLLLTVAAAAVPLRVELYTYEGVDYTCHIRDGQVWYESQARVLGRRALKPGEEVRLRKLLAREQFNSLPEVLRKKRVDSFDSVTVWDGKLQKKVTGSTSYDGPRQAEFKRFRAVIAGIRAVAPIPKNL